MKKLRAYCTRERYLAVRCRSEYIYPCFTSIHSLRLLFTLWFHETVCRTKDIHLSSSFGNSGGLSERPKLNLTVKKELQGMGGQIMAQSRMAKGPDGTNGFVLGWRSSN